MQENQTAQLWTFCYTTCGITNWEEMG